MAKLSKDDTTALEKLFKAHKTGDEEKAFLVKLAEKAGSVPDAPTFKKWLAKAQDECAPPPCAPGAPPPPRGPSAPPRH
jgi:hypothetical protein